MNVQHSNDLPDEPKMKISELLTKELKFRNELNTFTPWNDFSKRKLVGAILHGEKIGKIIIDEQGNILDGSQVYNTIQTFGNDGFRYDAKLFSELADEHKSLFLDYEVTVICISIGISEGVTLFNQLNK